MPSAVRLRRSPPFSNPFPLQFHSILPPYIQQLNTPLLTKPCCYRCSVVLLLLLLLFPLRHGPLLPSREEGKVSVMEMHANAGTAGAYNGYFEEHVVLYEWLLVWTRAMISKLVGTTMMSSTPQFSGHGWRGLRTANLRVSAFGCPAGAGSCTRPATDQDGHGPSERSLDAASDDVSPRTL